MVAGFASESPREGLAARDWKRTRYYWRWKTFCLSNEIFFLFSEIYKLHLNQAIAHLAEDEVQKGAPISTLHRYINMITLDASRTFPKMGIFQKGGPYYEHLLRLLGTDLSLSSRIFVLQSKKRLFFDMNIDSQLLTSLWQSYHELRAISLASKYIMPS